MKQDEVDVQKLLEILATQMINPFSLNEVSNKVIYLATGVVMPSETSTKLVSCHQTGKEALDLFVTERLITVTKGFWDTLPHLQIPTFATMMKKDKVKAIDGKVVSAKAHRELFGCLLIAAKACDVNLRDVLSFELSPVPYALAYPDSTLRQGTKSVLLGILEKLVESPSG